MFRWNLFYTEAYDFNLWSISDMLDLRSENLPRRTLAHPFSVHSSTSESESESSASGSAGGELARGESMDISSELSLVSESSDSDSEGFS